MKFNVYLYDLNEDENDGYKTFEYIHLGDITLHIDSQNHYVSYIFNLTNQRILKMPSCMHQRYGKFIRSENVHINDIIYNKNLVQGQCTDIIETVIMNRYNQQKRLKQFIKNYKHRKEACIHIQTQFRECMSNPNYQMCQRRLLREFSELESTPVGIFIKNPLPLESLSRIHSRWNLYQEST